MKRRLRNSFIAIYLPFLFSFLLWPAVPLARSEDVGETPLSFFSPTVSDCPGLSGFVGFGWSFFASAVVAVSASVDAGAVGAAGSSQKASTVSPAAAAVASRLRIATESTAVPLD